MQEIKYVKSDNDKFFYYSLLYNWEVFEYEQTKVPVDLDIIDYIDKYQYRWLLKQQYTDYDESANPSDIVIIRCIERVQEKHKQFLEDCPSIKDNDLPF